eukprot:1159509-Pelagomonas_calceolata.AAC.12
MAAMNTEKLSTGGANILSTRSEHTHFCSRAVVDYIAAWEELLDQVELLRECCSSSSNGGIEARKGAQGRSSLTCQHAVILAQLTHMLVTPSPLTMPPNPVMPPHACTHTNHAPTSLRPTADSP